MLRSPNHPLQLTPAACRLSGAQSSLGAAEAAERVHSGSENGVWHCDPKWMKSYYHHRSLPRRHSAAMNMPGRSGMSRKQSWPRGQPGLRRLAVKSSSAFPMALVSCTGGAPPPPTASLANPGRRTSTAARQRSLRASGRKYWPLIILPKLGSGPFCMRSLRLG
jgi:hypothetical protein